MPDPANLNLLVLRRSQPIRIDCEVLRHARSQSERDQGPKPRTTVPARHRSMRSYVRCTRSGQEYGPTDQKQSTARAATDASGVAGQPPFNPNKSLAHR
ncbi:hypothetical protein TRAPUB_10455 [Trametes pubescens]|uniref:Uncharacterized protein n=1 Tax=Trametes pubescens TaxID=154538 RepID=A0A1M2VZG3_TRAPU|nr:hypothetical protein TRAPUB_10455 [Trametes pubescens]